MTETNQSLNDIELGRAIRNYCEQKFIPLDYFQEIINDAKVIPMLRGKGVEYASKRAIEAVLNQHSSGMWLVEKKSLNPQPNAPDEDITIKHANYPTISIIVEAKSGALHTFVTGERTRKERNKQQPHFLVKCHRSRVNYTLATDLAGKRW
jgi:hypothetical protein